ncbi:hypothetical protein BC936DRAFT_145600 [Jimgerdemannia flammicorona]|uniref:Uncharacterized protein n=1 Tax=Jimgerdemannia flammicorona TaxID=994334 RepID=A0A433D9K1_9FUNG|nr:hypothetical protein BC936DRAFT_145600 [Jimgerdemannia flammicorona]
MFFYLLQILIMFLLTALVAYLKGRDPGLWSYFDFLSANRPIIANSSPFSDRWNDIDSAWTRRFLQEVQEINPTSVDVIKEKTGFKNTLDTESLTLLDAASKVQSRTVLADYAHQTAELESSNAKDVHIRPKRFHAEIDATSERENKRAAFEKLASGGDSSLEDGVEQRPFSDYSHDIEKDADEILDINNDDEKRSILSDNSDGEYIEDDKQPKAAGPPQVYANRSKTDQSNIHHQNKTLTKTKTYLKWCLVTYSNPVVVECQWSIDGKNISEAFFSYQELSKSMAIRKELNFATHPAEILALNSIFLMEENSTRAELDISQAIRARVFKQMRDLYPKSRLPQVVGNLCYQYVQAERELPKDDLDEELDNIYEELRKGLNVEDKKMLRTCRDIWTHMAKNCGTSFGKTRNIEDTHVHHSVHPLLRPFFPDEPGMTVEWANKASAASTSRKAARGHKPDFMISVKLTGGHELEMVFGLFKSPAKCAPSFSNVNLIDLAIMMKDSIDMYYKRGFELNVVTFGIHVFVLMPNMFFWPGFIARLYVMDLVFDGLYRMYKVGEFEFPRSNLGLALTECAIYEMMNFQQFVQETFRCLQSCTECDKNKLRTPTKKSLMVRPTVATPEKVICTEDK